MKEVFRWWLTKGEGITMVHEGDSGKIRRTKVPLSEWQNINRVPTVKRGILHKRTSTSVETETSRVTNYAFTSWVRTIIFVTVSVSTRPPWIRWQDLFVVVTKHNYRLYRNLWICLNDSRKYNSTFWPQVWTRSVPYCIPVIVTTKSPFEWRCQSPCYFSHLPKPVSNPLSDT